MRKNEVVLYIHLQKSFPTRWIQLQYIVVRKEGTKCTYFQNGLEEVERTEETIDEGVSSGRLVRLKNPPTVISDYCIWLTPGGKVFYGHKSSPESLRKYEVAEYRQSDSLYYQIVNSRFFKDINRIEVAQVEPKYNKDEIDSMKEKVGLLEGIIREHIALDKIADFSKIEIINNKANDGNIRMGE